MSKPPIPTLKKRADFLRLRKGRKTVMPSFILLAGRQPEENVDRRAACQDRLRGRIEPVPRIGYTVTRRIGNAVVRNRVRRRFREAVRQIAPGRLRPGYDYVLIARHRAPQVRFADLKEELRKAFERAGKSRRSGAARRQKGGEGDMSRKGLKGGKEPGARPERTTNQPQARAARPAPSDYAGRDSKGAKGGA